MARTIKTSSTNMENERPVKKCKTTRELAAATPRRHTRGMTTDAARRAVFDTPELLENIISFMSPTDILTKVQRLSRQWKNVVDSSPIIKNKLWMRVPNVIVIQPTSFSNEHTFPALPYWGTLEMPIYSHTVVFNPIPLERTRGPLKFSLNENRPVRYLVNFNGGLVYPTTVELSYRKANDRSDCSSLEFQSSWRDMYLTNPPITTALLSLDNYSDMEERYGPMVIRLSVRDHDGLTLGLIHDTIMRCLPSSVHGTLGTTSFTLVGSLDVAIKQHETSAASH